MSRSRQRAPLGDLLKSLVEDLIGAEHHYRIYQALVRETHERDAVISQAAAFWHYTIRAHRDAAIMHLARAYDTTRGSSSLRALVDAASAIGSKIDFKQVAADRAEVSASDSAVKALLEVRNNVFAHTSARTAATGALDVTQKYPITPAEIRALISRGFRLVQRYRGAAKIPLRTFGSLNPSFRVVSETGLVIDALERDFGQRMKEELLAEYEAEYLGRDLGRPADL
jgi:hypothetical protein